MKKNELNRRYRRGLRDIGYSLSRIKTSASYLKGYDFRPDVVFDVGVMNGTPYLYEAFASSKFVMIDPLLESEAVIADQGLELDYDFVVKAVGSAKGKLKLNIPTTKPGKGADMSSFLDRTDRIENLFSSVEQREVAVTTLDAISVKYSGRFGLKIDTEGFELEVLRGAKKTLKKCEFVILELSLTERFKGLAPPSSVIDLLTKSGLEFRDVLDVYPPPHRHLKPHLMDILFTRWTSD